LPRGRRILLLADDSPTIQKVISLTFSDQGFEVVTVGDGAEALRWMEEGVPDIVLADAVMPLVNGYELCERIKQDARFRHLPVMLLVGTFEPFNEAEARRVGADTVLTKPFQSIRDLVNKVGSMLGGGESKQDEDAADAGQTQREAAAADAVDQNLLREADMPVGRPAQEAHAVGANAPGDEGADELRQHPASFADIEMDDQMIEARPAEAFGSTAARADAEHADFEPEPFEPEPFGAEVFEEAGPRGVFERRAGMFDESSAASVSAAAQRETEEAFASRPAFGTRMADAAAADEALLDLGDLDPPGSSNEADDFILDLADDSPPSPAYARAATVGEETSFFDGLEFAPTHADAAGAFAEAAHGEPAPEASLRPFSTAPTGAGWGESSLPEAIAQDEPQSLSVSHTGEPGEEPRAEGAMALSQMGRAHEFIEPQVVPAEVPAPSEAAVEFTDGSVEGDVAKSPASLDPATARADDDGSVREASSSIAADTPEPSTEVAARGVAVGGMSPEQLSPEMIEAIARRVVELMSETVVREIAWEVVPDLAELLVRKRLDEEKR
jgi:CheY-like chemotaxis protein